MLYQPRGVNLARPRIVSPVRTDAELLAPYFSVLPADARLHRVLRSPLANTITGGLQVMRTVTLLHPRRLVFGRGCAKQCGSDLHAAGFRKAMFITSPETTGLSRLLIE